MRTPLWVKVLASELAQHDIVQHISIRNDYLKVRYKTQYTERYYIEMEPKVNGISFIVDRTAVRIRKVLKSHKQFTQDLLYPEHADNHVYLDTKEYRNLTIIEKRLAIHNLAHELANTSTKFPQTALMEDWGLYQKTPDNPLFKGLTCIQARSTAGMRILLHYFADTDQNTAKSFVDAVDKSLSRKAKRVMSDTIFKKVMGRRGSGTINPVGYHTLLKLLKIDGSVLDLHPDTGQKALVCAKLGIRYITPRTTLMQAAIDGGFADIIGLVHEWVDDQSIDLVISDNYFKGFDISPVKPYMSKAKRLAAYVPGKDRQRIRELYNPSQFIPFYRSRLAAQDYVALW